MKLEHVVQCHLNICFRYGVCSFHPHLTTHQSNIGVQLRQVIEQHQDAIVRLGWDGSIMNLYKVYMSGAILKPLYAQNRYLKPTFHLKSSAMYHNLTFKPPIVGSRYIVLVLSMCTLQHDNLHMELKILLMCIPNLSFNTTHNIHH